MTKNRKPTLIPRAGEPCIGSPMQGAFPTMIAGQFQNILSPRKPSLGSLGNMKNNLTDRQLVLTAKPPTSRSVQGRLEQRSTATQAPDAAADLLYCTHAAVASMGRTRETSRRCCPIKSNMQGQWDCLRHPMFTPALQQDVAVETIPAVRAPVLVLGQMQSRKLGGRHSTFDRISLDPRVPTRVCCALVSVY